MRDYRFLVHMGGACLSKSFAGDSPNGAEPKLIAEDERSLFDCSPNLVSRRLARSSCPDPYVKIKLVAERVFYGRFMGGSARNPRYCRQNRQKMRSMQNLQSPHPTGV